MLEPPHKPPKAEGFKGVFTGLGRRNRLFRHKIGDDRPHATAYRFAATMPSELVFAAPCRKGAVVAAFIEAFVEQPRRLEGTASLGEGEDTHHDCGVG